MCLSLLANLAMRQPPAISNGDSWGNSHKKPSPGSHKAKNQKKKTSKLYGHKSRLAFRRMIYGA